MPESTTLTTASAPTTVFIADDQAMVRQGFGALLAAQHDISVVGDAPDGRIAVAEVARLRPDVVLMDVRMPEMNGLDAARRILADTREPKTRVLMLTTFDLDEYVYEALGMGASGSCSRTHRPTNSSAPSAWSPRDRRYSRRRLPAG